MIAPERERLAVWMRPALTRLDAAEFERCAAWVAVLDESYADLDELALAAHNHLTQALVSDLESTLSGADVGYKPGGKRALLSRLAGSALMGVMARGGNGAARAGLLTCSAAFVGLEPTISELPNEARASVTRAGVEVRRRSTPTRVAPKRRKAVEAADEASATIAQLRAELALRDTTISLLSKRVDELMDSQRKQTSMVEEEVDALWWERSDTSWTTGEVWSDIKPLDRGVLAGLEVGSLLRWAPIAPAHARLVAAVTAGSESFGAVEIAATVGRYCGAAPQLVDLPAILRPLAFASAAYQGAQGEEETVRTTLLEALSLKDSWRKSAHEVAEQLLVERCLEMIV